MRHSRRILCSYPALMREESRGERFEHPSPEQARAMLRNPSLTRAARRQLERLAGVTYSSA